MKITVGEHLRARHNQRVIQQRQQKQSDTVIARNLGTLNSYAREETMPITYAENTISARLRQQFPGSVLTQSENIVGNDDHSSNRLSPKIKLVVLKKLQNAYIAVKQICGKNENVLDHSSFRN